jgi:ribonuclease Z
VSLSAGFTWTHDDLSLTGYSLAGITTSVVFPAADVCFDVGQGLPFQVPVTNIALTHGHLDHAAGLPYLLGQKAMHGVKRPNIYMPKSLVKPMSEILSLWAQIEEHTYDYHLEGLGPGDERDLKGKYFLKTFPTYHRIPSQGYTVFLRKKHLLPEYRGLSHVELGKARREGKAIDEHFSEPVVSFTGDTKIEVMESDAVRRSRVLLMECTYWDENKTVENARQWGHTHLDEILPWLDRLDCEKILLIHSSVRYPAEQLQKILDLKVPARHRPRVELFPRI